MKTLIFKYTKADGKVSERTLLALVIPGDKYAGIDLSELEPNEAMNFVHEVEILHEKYIMDMQALQTKFDLKYSYRQFFADKMTELCEI